MLALWPRACCFFFQAEDGIRDYKVTGVQTCALPISIEILEGLLEPTAGEVEVLGRRWGGRDDGDLRQRIGISLQETRLSEKLTVRETVRSEERRVGKEGRSRGSPYH